MRIIAVKLSKDTTDYIRVLSQRVLTKDFSFLEDLYALFTLKGNGIPDDAKCDAYAAHYSKALKQNLVVTRALVKKRRQLLKSLILTGMFSKWVKNSCGVNTLAFLEEFVTTNQRLNKKVQQAACLTCPLLADCQFGKQYGHQVTSINVVIDPDYSKKVHSQCPSLPAIGLTNELANAVNFTSKLSDPHNAAALAPKTVPTMYNPAIGDFDPHLSAEEAKQISAGEAAAQSEEYAQDENLEVVDPDEFHEYHDSDDDGVIYGFRSYTAGKTPGFRNSSIYGTYNILDGKIVDKLSMAQLVLYEIAMKLDSMLAKAKKGAFSDVEHLTQEKRQSKIKSVSDVTKVTSSQHALPDDVFDAKLAKKDLTKNQQQEREKKKQLLYLLVDVSGSMGSQVGSNSIFGYISRASLTVAYCLAMCRRVKEDKGILFFRPFESSPGPFRSCRTDAEFDSLQRYISNSSFSGGGTNIPRAVETAIDDVLRAKDELRKAEILLITDAADNFRADEVKRIRNKMGSLVVLNTFDVSGDNVYTVKTVQDLSSLSDHYFKFDNSKSSLEKMVELVGGKKKKV